MLQGKDILVVDDRADIRYTIATVLKRNGFGVVLASDGLSALKKAATHKVWLYLLDVDLPDMDGFELCRRLKSDSTREQIPVVMCSANCAEEDLLQAASSGADAYISKPFDMVKLIDCINRIWTQNMPPIFDPAAAQEVPSVFGRPMDCAQPSRKNPEITLL